MSVIFHPDGRVETTTVQEGIEWRRYLRTEHQRPGPTTSAVDPVEPLALPKVADADADAAGGDVLVLSEETRWKDLFLEKLDDGDRAIWKDFLDQGVVRWTEARKIIAQHGKGPAHYFKRMDRLAEASGLPSSDVYKHESKDKMSTYEAGRLMRLYGI